MTRQIFRARNSAVVCLPPEVMEITGLAVGDEANIAANPERDQIIITPAAPSGVRPSFLGRVDHSIDRCGPALEALASD